MIAVRSRPRKQRTRAEVNRSEVPEDGWHKCYITMVEVPAEMSILVADIRNSIRSTVQGFDPDLR